MATEESPRPAQWWDPRLEDPRDEPWRVLWELIDEVRPDIQRSFVTAVLPAAEEAARSVLEPAHEGHLAAAFSFLVEDLAAGEPPLGDPMDHEDTPERVAFQRVLEEWLRGSILLDDWLREAAVEAALLFLGTGEVTTPLLPLRDSGRIEWGPPEDLLNFDPPKLVLEFCRSHLTHWSDFRDHVLATVSEHLREYKQQWENASRAQGLEQVPWKERQRRIEQEDHKHLRWLVRYQFVGESRSNIARSPDDSGREVTADAVRKALELWANRLGLTLREEN